MAAVGKVLERGREWKRRQEDDRSERGGWQPRREEKTDLGEGGVEKEWVVGSKWVGENSVVRQQRERDEGFIQ